MLVRLKNQARLLQQREKNNSSNSSNNERSHTPPPQTKSSDFPSKSKKDLKLSLVPGYEDDSDGEDDSSNNKKPSKPLFPISQNNNQSETTVAKKFETNIGNIRIYDYRNADSTTESKPEATNSTDDQNNVQSSVEDTIEESLEPKINKFLENIDLPSKAFKRKKRIAFDGLHLILN